MTTIINSDIGFPTINVNSTYDSTKVYTCYVNPVNRHITAFIGFQHGVESVNRGDNFPYYNITDLTEQEYKDVSLSLNSTESMAFLDTDNRSVYCRRIYVDLLEDTFYDPVMKKIYAVDNKVNLRVKCIDEYFNIPVEVETVQVKNLLDNQPISFNGQEFTTVKMTLSNPSDITCELLGEGTHTIQVKAVLNEVDYLFLTAYPQMLKISDSDNANLKAYIASTK